ncbi:MFS transporter [Brevibacterium sp. 5221]|uniref:Putative proline/betaine transporter n=1 Tax=Brevibacterium rongguiense TaxID=2695267 RepID=A0A6N9HA74_9MICO|nr:MFS transporter [Brevibacterium rongguiense]MYM20422.1 MFS transporter [Brevibacterium rongguiense]
MSQHIYEPASKSMLRKVVAASLAGTTVEWYEFFLYGSAVSLVFNHILFPPSDNPLTPILAGFVTYAVGFIARPIGGIVFGHFGDRMGRKKLLQLSIILVGASTFLMGCLPTYAQIGLWAPVLLVLMRIVQGFAVGGEWGGAVLLVAEHSPNDKRGFWASWPQVGVPLGNLLATAVLWASSGLLSEQQFLSWGWRIGFWLSAVIVLIGYYIRSKVEDAPIFHLAQQEVEQDAAGYGVIEVFKRYPRGVFCAMGLRLIENIHYYLVVTFSITYLALHGLKGFTILGLLMGATAVETVLVPLVGAMADRVGRKLPYAIGIVLSTTWPFMAFPMFDTKQPFTIFLAMLLGLIFHALMYAGQPAIMAEMFPTRMRYSGVSIGYQVTAIVAGSLAPIIATWLLGTFNATWPIGVYVVIAAAISMVALFFTRETKGISLADVDKLDDESRLVKA